MEHNDAFVRLAARWFPTEPWDQAEIEDVLDSATLWWWGHLPLSTFQKIGCLTSITTGMVSPEYTRLIALLTTDRADPRRKDLLAAIDTLIRYGGKCEITDFGIFDYAELGERNVPVYSRPPKDTR